MLMGPNGSGKSTLAMAIAGNPKYKITKGKIFFKGKDITELDPSMRSRMGLLISFQLAPEIEGVKLLDLLGKIMEIRHERRVPIRAMLEREIISLYGDKINLLGLDSSMLNRELNVGMSGGERKKIELLQAVVHMPDMLILDEIDSGVDVDSLRAIGGILNEMRRRMSLLIITHQSGILKYIDKVDRVHVMVNGRIMATGGAEIFDRIQQEGYSWLL
ncbi:MAG: Fe-S cluster assembly ATPase SufC [Thermoproteota archaeon]|nr:MAG: Fe-S cluster assembly ATPase SufC [Candidatus Korarchaeota archaeon]